MLSKNNNRKTDQVQLISVEQLVPKNHIFRKIDKFIDFNFIYELVEDKYSLDNGRPSIDPVVLIINTIHRIPIQHKKHETNNKRNRSKHSI